MMNAAKHTPGPWPLGDFGNHGGYDCMTAGIEVGPAALDGFFYGQGRCEPLHPDDKARMMADARLIAAAPDLLAALKWMVENDETNEGDDPLEHLHGRSWNDVNAHWLEGLNRARAAIASATGEVPS